MLAFVHDNFDWDCMYSRTYGVDPCFCLLDALCLEGHFLAKLFGDEEGSIKGNLMQIRLFQ